MSETARIGPAVESRTTALPVELRGGASRTIGGYALVFNSDSENLGGFIERIAPSFVDKSRGDGWPGVVCRFNHQDEYILGATRSGTLQLSVDSTGLNYSVDLPVCRGDVLEMVSRGDVAHSSFAFQTFQDDWSVSAGGQPLRTLVSGKIIDVAPGVNAGLP
ncbi:MAG: phage prohead protease, family [Mycobacterium sp.]|nr:phage prohead protease, family [Mycobacterium sp.]